MMTSMSRWRFFSLMMLIWRDGGWRLLVWREMMREKLEIWKEARRIGGDLDSARQVNGVALGHFTTKNAEKLCQAWRIIHFTLINE